MKTYISIPISGHDYETQKQKAENIKKWLLMCGLDPVTPFDISPDRDASYAHHMGRDIEALLGCDSIVMLPGWEKSKGCRLEYTAALIYGLGVLEINQDGPIFRINYTKKVYEE